MKTDYDFQKRMAEGRENAANRRSKGQVTGKAAKGHIRVVKRPAPEGWALVVAQAIGRWRAAAGDAREQYRFDVYGDQWEGF